MKGATAFCQVSDNGRTKDEARPLVRVSALCSLQCFKTAGWVPHSRPWTNGGEIWHAGID